MRCFSGQPSYKELQAQNVSLQNQVAELQERRTDLLARNSDLQARCTDLQASTTELQSQKDELTMLLERSKEDAKLAGERAETERGRIMQELEHEEATTSKLKATVSELHEKQQQLCSEQEDTLTKLQEAEACQSALSAQLGSTEAELQQCKSRLKHTESVVEKLRADYDASHKDVKRLRQQRDQFRREVENLKEVLKQVNTFIEDFMSDQPGGPAGLLGRVMAGGGTSPGASKRGQRQTQIDEACALIRKSLTSLALHKPTPGGLVTPSAMSTAPTSTPASFRSCLADSNNDDQNWATPEPLAMSEVGVTDISFEL